jgi:hypothetical protein
VERGDAAEGNPEAARGGEVMAWLAGLCGWCAALAVERVAEGRYGWACLDIALVGFYAVLMVASRAPSSRSEER